MCAAGESKTALIGGKCRSSVEPIMTHLEFSITIGHWLVLKCSHFLIGCIIILTLPPKASCQFVVVLIFDCEIVI